MPFDTESVGTEPYTAEDPGPLGQDRGASASEISNLGAFPGGYIGDSTRSEIAYALSLGLPVRYTDPSGAAVGPALTSTSLVPESRSTEPRVLASYELAEWSCPRCEESAVEGTQAWDDRGPHQLLSVHRLWCQAGHSWSNHNDGG